MPVSWRCMLLCSAGSACRVCPSPTPATSELDQEMRCGHPKKLGGADVYSAPVQGCVQALSRQPRESCVEAPHRPRRASLLVACKYRFKKMFESVSKSILQVY